MIIYYRELFNDTMRAFQGRYALPRQFHSAQVLLARQVKKLATPTKKQLAAKARKKALKARKNIYDSEKMTLADAIAVLRVCPLVCFLRYASSLVTLQAVEVTAPNATYELVVRTEMKKGSTIPKGRYSLPREPKEKSKDRILVFAEGRIAEEAKRAGADIVGGPELADGVRTSSSTLECSTSRHTHRS